MAIFIVTFAVMALVIAAMAVGVLAGGKPISGSCGGVGAALGEKDYTCELCGGDEAKCEEQRAGVQQRETDLAYDASASEKASR